MVTTSALHRSAGCLIRCCGVLSLIAILVLASASFAWCTSRNGRQADIQVHRFRVQNEKIDQVPVLIADKKNGSFQYRFYFEIGYLVKSPCRECLKRKKLPKCVNDCTILDKIQILLSESVSCTKNL